MPISDLKPFARSVNLIVKVTGKNEIREVQSKNDQSQHKVTEAIIGDASGICLLTLWDDAIDKVEIGKIYEITNAYTNLFQRKLRLNLGRFGTIAESTQSVEVNEGNNVSDKEQPFTPRPFNNRGGGSYGGGGNRTGGFGGGRRDGGNRGGRFDQQNNDENSEEY